VESSRRGGGGFRKTIGREGKGGAVVGMFGQEKSRWRTEFIAEPEKKSIPASAHRTGWGRRIAVPWRKGLGFGGGSGKPSLQVGKKAIGPEEEGEAGNLGEVEGKRKKKSIDS